MLNETQGKPRRLRGSDLLITDIHETAGLLNQPAHQSIEDLMTFDGRIPQRQAIKSLTNFERRLMTYLEGHVSLTLSPLETVKDLPEHSTMVIQEKHIGHVSILVPSQFDTYALSDPLHIAGAVKFTPVQFAEIEQIKIEEGLRVEAGVKESADWLKQREAAGTLQPVLDNIHENLIRIGPTFLHVGHQIYSTFDRVGKNVVDVKPDDKRLLSEIAKKPVDTWGIEEQVYVYGAHLLLSSFAGPRAGARMEEFNGAQLNPDALREFFDKKAEFYCDATGTDIPEDWNYKDLPQKAQWIGQKMGEVDQTHLRYRKINGLNLRQEEWILGEKEKYIPKAIPENLLDRMHTVFGIQLRDGETNENYWRRVTNNMVEQGKLPFLIWSVISTAVEATNSDFGMSSTFRDANQLLNRGALDLAKQDFYCAVVPSQKVMATQSGEEIGEAMRLMAARMEYNRWHFLPANLPKEEIPDSRDWFGSPSTPDLATEIDFHHGGHIEAKVHHSIRYPQNITVGGREFKGVYDIRLARQEGSPFSIVELVKARGYLDALGNVLTTVVQNVEDTDALIRVEGYTPDWYKNQSWKPWAQESGL